MKSLFDIILIFAAGFGFFVSWYIRHKKLARERMVCYLGSNCDNIVHSQYSVFLGVPVEVLGMIYYSLLALSHGILVAVPAFATPSVIFALLAATSAAFLFSMYLIFIQAFTLKEFCTWCLVSAGLCTIIFFSAIGSLTGDFIAFLASTQNLFAIFHAFGVAIGLGAATIADIFFLKFLGRFRISKSEADILHTLSQVIWAALGILVLSGLGLYLPEAAALSVSAKFLARMIVVGVIILNGAFLNLFISPKLIRISFGEAHHHTPGELHYFRKLAFGMGAVSIISWYTAFVFGFLSEASSSLQNLLTIYLVIAAIAVVISQIVERYYSRAALES